MNPLCDIHDCDKPGRWLLRTEGHPNGDIGAWYCQQHAHTIPNWDDSPSVYTITVSGPHGN